MEKEQSYFGELGHGIKTLAVGMKTTLKEYAKDYWTNKSTEQYPENRKTLKMHPRYRGKLEMIEDAEGNNHCTACGMCERACPNASINVLATKNIAGKKVLGRYVYHFASCTQCGLCVEACPFGAIQMSPAFEVATTDPNDLEMILNKKEGQG